MLLDQQEKLYERQSELKAILEACRAFGSPKATDDAPPTALEDWSGTFDWDSKADHYKFHVFGISKYRANQHEVSIFLSIYLPIHLVREMSSLNA